MNAKDWENQISFFDKMEVQQIRTLLYGEPKVGKTRLAGTYPKPFFIDTDRGGMTLSNLHIPYLELHEGDEVYAIISSILQKGLKGEGPFSEGKIETIVFDSISTLADHLLMDSMEHPPAGSKRMPKKADQDKAEFDNWGELLARLRHIFRLCKDLKLNVVGICGVQIDKDEKNGGMVGRPLIQGSFRNEIGHHFDSIFYLSKEGSGANIDYNLYTTRYSYFQAGNRRPGPPLPAIIKDPTFAKLYPEVAKGVMK